MQVEDLIEISRSQFGWDVTFDGTVAEFHKQRPCGMEYTFDINLGRDFSKREMTHKFMAALHTHMRHFDVSYVTTLFLDDTGHGNPALHAPDSMNDVWLEVLEFRYYVITLYKGLCEVLEAKT